LGPDPALRPVVATNYELGWHFRGPAGLDASATAYWTAVRDDIFFIASSVTGGYFQNIGATRRAGAEAALDWTSRAGLRLYANYGFTAATFRSSALLATTRDPAGETVAPGDALPMVPSHRVNAGIALPVVRERGARPSVRVALDARYVARQWLRGDEANATRRLADYGALVAALLGPPAAAAQGSFDGLVVYKVSDADGKSGLMRYYQLGNRTRQEFEMNGVAAVSIFDGTTGDILTLMPQHKQYLVMNMKQLGPHMGQMAQALQGQKGATGDLSKMKVTATGKSETIAGISCEHFLFASTDEGSHGPVDVCGATGMGFMG